MKKILIVLVALVLVVGVGYYLIPAKLSVIPQAKEHTATTTAAANEEEGPEHVQSPAAQREVLKAALVGKWQSTQDPKSARQFNANGTFSDFYNGDPAGAPGTWDVATDGVGRIALFSEGDTLEYQVIAVTPERLELTYLARGNTLTYEKVR